MACDNCDEVTKDEPSEAAMLLYSTDQRTIVGRDRRTYKLEGPVIPPDMRPRGGWHVTLMIRGQTMRVDGGHPKTVVRRAGDLLTENGIRFEPRDLWFNCNLQWVERCPASRVPVTVDMLLEIAGTGNPEHAPTRDRKRVSPDVWGPRGWGMLQMYLALDTYDWGKFLMLAFELHQWVDPVKNPTTGCAECFRDYGIALAELRKRPRYDQNGAREWLHSTMNAIRAKKGLDPVTFEEASVLNHWT